MPFIFLNAHQSLKLRRWWIQPSISKSARDFRILLLGDLV